MASSNQSRGIIGGTSLPLTHTGIDPEIMPRLFEKFASKSYQGTGLGLYICKNIVEAHGGRIWANNNNSNSIGRGVGGATFTFSLQIREHQHIELEHRINLQ
jgi:signal transduction histidine kinase